MSAVALFSALGRGVAAGAAGVTALNLVTYLDMATRGRPSSSVPEQVVDKLAAAAGTSIPGDQDTRDARRTALGALSGIVTGTAVAVAASVAREAGLRVPFPVGAALTGVLAMAASDGPASTLGVTRPSRWAAADWISDIVPHLGYGVAVSATLRALER